MSVKAMSVPAKLKRVFLAYIAFSLLANAAFWIFGAYFFATGYYLEGTWLSFNPALLVTGPALGFSSPSEQLVYRSPLE